MRFDEVIEEGEEANNSKDAFIRRKEDKVHADLKNAIKSKTDRNELFALFSLPRVSPDNYEEPVKLEQYL